MALGLRFTDKWKYFDMGKDTNGTYIILYTYITPEINLSVTKWDRSLYNLLLDGLGSSNFKYAEPNSS